MAEWRFSVAQKILLLENIPRDYSQALEWKQQRQSLTVFWNAYIIAYAMAAPRLLDTLLNSVTFALGVRVKGTSAGRISQRMTSAQHQKPLFDLSSPAFLLPHLEPGLLALLNQINSYLCYQDWMMSMQAGE